MGSARMANIMRHLCVRASAAAPSCVQAMRLSDPLKRCFDELARLCEDLQAENQHLKNELEGLKSKAPLLS